MEQVQRGDGAAFTVLFNRYRSSLYAYLVRLSGRQELADEVFQETFLNVHRARATWSANHGSFRTWLFRIATNAARDRARHAARRPEVLSDDWVLTHREYPADRIALERAMADLPVHLREAFLLGAVQGFDHNEIAAALSVTPDNARARLARARSRLRELLEES